MQIPVQSAFPLSKIRFTEMVSIRIYDIVNDINRAFIYVFIYVFMCIVILILFSTYYCDGAKKRRIGAKTLRVES